MRVCEMLSCGEMSEWFKEPVLKTGDSSRAVGSNPTLSAIFSSSGLIQSAEEAGASAE